MDRRGGVNFSLAPSTLNKNTLATLTNLEIKGVGLIAKNPDRHGGEKGGGVKNRSGEGLYYYTE